MKPDTLRDALNRRANPAQVEPAAAPAVPVAVGPVRRKGKSLIGGFFPTPVRHQLRRLAAQQEVSIQRLLGEALNDLFQKHGKPEIVELDTL